MEQNAPHHTGPTQTLTLNDFSINKLNAESPKSHRSHADPEPDRHFTV